MARRNFKMLYLNRNRLTVDQTRIYATMPLIELKALQKDLESLQKINFTTERYNQLGAVKTAILRLSPLCVKLPKPEVRKEATHETKWRPVKVRED